MLEVHMSMQHFGISKQILMSSVAVLCARILIRCKCCTLMHRPLKISVCSWTPRNSFLLWKSWNARGSFVQTKFKFYLSSKLHRRTRFYHWLCSKLQRNRAIILCFCFYKSYFLSCSHDNRKSSKNFDKNVKKGLRFKVHSR